MHGFKFTDTVFVHILGCEPGQTAGCWIRQHVWWQPDAKIDPVSHWVEIERGFLGSELKYSVPAGINTRGFQVIPANATVLRICHQNPS